MTPVDIPVRVQLAKFPLALRLALHVAGWTDPHKMATGGARVRDEATRLLRRHKTLHGNEWRFGLPR